MKNMCSRISEIFVYDYKIKQSEGIVCLRKTCLRA